MKQFLFYAMVMGIVIVSLPSILFSWPNSKDLQCFPAFVQILSCDLSIFL